MQRTCNVDVQQTNTLAVFPAIMLHRKAFHTHNRFIVEGLPSFFFSISSVKCGLNLNNFFTFPKSVISLGQSCVIIISKLFYTRIYKISVKHQPTSVSLSSAGLNCLNLQTSKFRT